MVDLADTSRIIAMLDEVLRQRWADAEVFCEFVRRAVRGDSDSLGKHPRHECRARGTANRILRVGARESHSAGGQSVNVRRSALRVAVAPQRLCAQVVGDDEQDVGLATADCSAAQRVDWRINTPHTRSQVFGLILR